MTRNTKKTSIRGLFTRYSLFIFIITTIGFGSLVFLGNHLLNQLRAHHQAFQSQTLELYFSDFIRFYQGIVDNIARQQTVRDTLALEDESTATKLSKSFHDLLPDSLAVALFDTKGEVIGNLEGVKIGPQCLNDLKQMLEGKAVSVPPVHQEFPGMSHFDLTSNVVADDGEILGILFVSFSLDVLEQRVKQLQGNDIRLRIIGKNGNVIYRNASDDEISRYHRTETLAIRDTDWKVIFSSLDFSEEFIGDPTAFIIIFILLGAGILITSIIQSYQLSSIMTTNIQLLKEGFEQDDETIMTSPISGQRILKELEPIVEETRRMIVDRKNLYRELADRMQRYRMLTENNSFDVIWSLDSDGCYVYLNPAIENRLGYTRDELLGKSVETVLTEESKIHFRETRAYILEHGKLPIHRFEFQEIHKDGSIIWIEAIADILYDEQGKPSELTGISRDITERKLLEKQLHQMAYHDHLTDLYNRAGYHRQLGKTIKQASRNKQIFALLLLDLDKFKPVNDIHGHNTGDVLLQQVAERITRLLRETDIVCRLGGDEFAIILYPLNAEDDASTVAEKILATLNEPFECLDNLCNISGSIGISLYPKHAETDENLLREADESMYVAKKNKPDQNSCHVEEWNAS